MAKNKTFSLQWQAFTSTLSTTLVLLMLGLTILSVQSAGRMSDYVKSKLSVTVELREYVTDAQGQQLANSLKKRAYVKDAKFITKEQVQEEMRNKSTDSLSHMDLLSVNPYPSEIEITLKPEYANSAAIQNITSELHQLKEAGDVDDTQKGLADGVESNLHRIIFIFVCVSILLLIIFAVLINNTVRLSIYSRRFLIHTMKLVGASWSFISRPFMIRSMWIGLIASAIANFIIIVMVKLLNVYDASFNEFITLKDQVVTAGCVVACGLFITLFCTYVCVNHFLNMNEGSMND